MNTVASKKVAIFGNSCQDRHLTDLAQFLSELATLPVTVYVERIFAEYLKSKLILSPCMIPVSSVPEDTGIVISIGGDGTFLRAADWTGSLSIPVMGINTGHLGYLTGFTFNNPAQIIDAILHDRYELTERMLIEVRSNEIPDAFRPYALNEISVSKGDTTSMVSIRAYSNGKFIAEYLADGLITATPTGSTAYNLSCGGPILEPTMQSFILTPIAPHSLTLRPLVIDGSSELLLEVHSRGEKCHVGVDGRTFAISSDGAEIRITKAPYSIGVAQPTDSDFASILRSKLAWGI